MSWYSSSVSWFCLDIYAKTGGWGGARLCNSVEPFSGSKVTDASRYRLGQEAVPKYNEWSPRITRARVFLVYCLVGRGLSIAGGCHLPKSVNGGGLGHAIFTGCVLYMGLNVESGQCQG